MLRRRRKPAAISADIEDTRESLALEHQARTGHAVELVNAALAAQARLEEDDRNLELIDLCLEVRSALAPSPAGSHVLKELPPVRRAVPYVPGPS